ncbi:hypothetical protein E4U50_000453, partial [Claviceps purpurea]
MWFANELHDFLPLDFAWALIDPFLVLQRSQIARVCISLPQSQFTFPHPWMRTPRPHGPPEADTGNAH